MKLVVAIVHPEDAGALVDALTDKEYRVTRLHSQGGFLKTSNASIIVGVEEAQVEMARQKKLLEGWGSKTSS